MGTADRFARLIRAYVNHEWDRIRGIVDEASSRAAAEAELYEALDPRSELPPPSGPVSGAPPRPPQRESSSSESLEVHYRVLGLPVGADFALVRNAYQRLMHRSDPSRFLEGSGEAVRAAEIQKEVQEAYDRLRSVLDPSAGRFADLET